MSHILPAVDTAKLTIRQKVQLQSELRKLAAQVSFDLNEKPANRLDPADRQFWEIFTKALELPETTDGGLNRFATSYGVVKFAEVRKALTEFVDQGCVPATTKVQRGIILHWVIYSIAKHCRERAMPILPRLVLDIAHQPAMLRHCLDQCFPGYWRAKMLAFIARPVQFDDADVEDDE